MVPKANEQPRMLAFFSCIATLMQANLLELFNESLSEYKKFICMELVGCKGSSRPGSCMYVCKKVAIIFSVQDPKHRPKLVVRFISRHSQLIPVPSFEEWENVLLSVVDRLVEVSYSFPKMEVNKNQYNFIDHVNMTCF